jgi:hypothetical protein
MGNWVRMALFSAIKVVVGIFYKTEVSWVETKEEQNWDEVRMIIFLNHTSLFEFLFLSAVPFSALMRMASHITLPFANNTADRPVTGRFFKILVPKLISITRQRDESWDHFMHQIGDEDIVLIFAEGRMMRKGGLDKNGQPMSARGGVADLMTMLEKGKVVIAYSGGLHHVQAPGDKIPRVFKKIAINFEKVDLADYIKSLPVSEELPFKKAVRQDLDKRLMWHKPKN